MKEQGEGNCSEKKNHITNLQQHLLFPLNMNHLLRKVTVSDTHAFTDNSV